MEVEKVINIELDFGTLFLFKHSELMQSDTSKHQEIIININKLRVITQNINTVYNDFEIASFDGISVVYERPAKGGGIINLSFKKSENEIIDGFYIYLNIEKDEFTGWNYKMWEEKVEWFNQNVISEILSLTKNKTIKKIEYSNC